VRVFSLRLLLVLFLGTVLGCERELPFQSYQGKPIVGYQIEGYVTDHLGVPLKGIKVALWYDYEFVDTVRAPSTDFFVDDSTRSVLVRVYDRNQKVRAILLEGHAPAGSLDIEWNKRDSFGSLVPSGVYTVDFSVNGVSRASYAVVVDGAVTAVTDTLGYYVIPNENLPVGYYPVPRTIDPDPSSYGSYRITPLVTLELYLDVHRWTSITLTKDQVTRHDFVI
jgi:hypothetical protein